MAEPCDLCQNVVSFDEDYRPYFIVQQDYFHRPCASCDNADYRMPGLCAWCEHLRIRHLIKCLRVHDVWPRPHFYMRQDLLTNPTAVDCPLCRVFRHVLLSMSHRITIQDLTRCCMELSLSDDANSIRGWFTSNQVDDMVGPMFYICNSDDGEYTVITTTSH